MLLLRIFAGDAAMSEADVVAFQRSLEDPKLDVCHEVSREELREALENLMRPSQAQEVALTLDAIFPEDVGHLTVYEVCARAGRGELLRELQALAQAKLRDLIFTGKATMRQAGLALSPFRP